MVAAAAAAFTSLTALSFTVAITFVALMTFATGSAALCGLDFF
jgi:hypothetical protein